MRRILLECGKPLIAVFIVAILVFLAACSSAPTPSPTPTSSPTSTPYQYPYGPGGMMGPGGLMGPGGMMGPGGPYRTGETRISMDRAVQIINQYLGEANNPDLKASEILEFTYNFYVAFVEKSTSIHAFEALVDPYTGDMYPEPGPNMMWNTKYGVMSGMMWGTLTNAAPMTVTEEAAKGYAQEFLNSYLPGAKVGVADRFYGYYTIEILSNGQTYGMLSVNGYTGQVWYHSWHGAFIGMQELN